MYTRADLDAALADFTEARSKWGDAEQDCSRANERQRRAGESLFAARARVNAILTYLTSK